MPAAAAAADFAAAQQRIAARRAQRAASQRAHHEASQPARALPRLPFPFGRLTWAWDAVKGRPGTRPEFRVGQVDAELLDQELLELLTGQVGEAFKLFGSHMTDNWTPEMLLGLRLVLFKLSIWDQNASYGAHLQGLRYTDARSTAPNRPPPKPWQKAAYGLVTIGGRYAWTKWQEHLLSAQDDYTRPESPQRKLLSALTERLTAFHDMASLASFLVFLVNGRYRTITDRLLRLRLTPTSHSTSRQVSFEYLNRQLVWHAFTEFLLFLLPLVGISRWRRILARTWRKLRASFLSLLGRSTPSSDSSSSSSSSSEDTDTDPKSGELSFLPERTCAICYRDQNPSSASEADMLASSAGGGGVVGSAATDITNPYEASPCACIYCFACLAQRIANEEGEGWTCLRCGETITQCAPWAGDILEPQPRRSPATLHHHTPESNTTKAVCFATHRPPPPQGKTPLRNVDPIPHHDDDDDDEDDDDDDADDDADDHGREIHSLQRISGLPLGDSLAWTESDEWARQSGEDHTQSEEYDDDEEEEEEEEQVSGHQGQGQGF